MHNHWQFLPDMELPAMQDDFIKGVSDNNRRVLFVVVFSSLFLSVLLRDVT